MKYFGEYLVDKGVIKEEGLLEALFEQAREVPFMSELAFKSRIISNDSILKALVIQAEKRIDFKEACVSLNLWTDEIELKILSELNKARKPLGYYLVKNGNADLSSITKALDEFLSKKGKEDLTVDKKFENSANVPGATMGQLKEKSNLDTLVVEEFLNTLNNQKIDVIKNLLNGLPILEGDLKVQCFDALVKDLHLIRSMLRMLKLDVYEGLFISLEEIAEKIFEKIKKMENIETKDFAESGLQSLLLVEMLQIELKKDSSGQNLFSSENILSIEKLKSQIHKYSEEIKL